MSMRLTGADTAGLCSLFLFCIMQHTRTNPVIVPLIRTTAPAAIPMITPVEMIGVGVDVLDAALDAPVAVALAPEPPVIKAPVPVAAAVMIVFWPVVGWRLKVVKEAVLV